MVQAMQRRRLSFSAAAFACLTLGLANVSGAQEHAVAVRTASADCQVHPGTLRVDRASPRPTDSAPCLVVLGDLEISGPELAPLRVVSVAGSVKVKRYLGADLRALAGLTSIGGGLEIEKNAALQHLSGLDRLETIGRDLEIDGNARLASLDGLRALQSVGGDVEIEHNAALRSLDGLQQLTTIQGDLEIEYNPQLRTLRAVNGLSHVGQTVKIKGNAALCQEGAQRLATRLTGTARRVANNSGACR